MRVAIINDAGFGWGRPGLFGKELYVELLAKGLESLNIDVARILLSSSPNGKEGVITVSGTSIPIVRAFLDLDLEHKLKELLQGFDIVHVNVLNARYPRHIVRVVKRLGKPLVVTMHSWAYLCPTGWVVKVPGNEVHAEPRLGFRCIRCLWNVGKYYGANSVWFTMDGFNRTLALQGLLRSADAVISPSRLLADAVKRIIKIDYVYAIPNPVPDELLQLKPNYGGDGSITFFARLTHEKGAHLIPELAKRLPNTIIHVMGDGYLKDFIVKASRDYGNIIYHGFVSNEEKVRIVCNSSFVIMPINWTETFPYTVLESFALGKPVVAFGLGGPKELIEDSGAGFLAKPFDIDDFISKIRYLVNNEEIVKEMGIRGRSFVEKLNLRSYVMKILEVYREISR